MFFFSFQISGSFSFFPSLGLCFSSFFLSPCSPILTLLPFAPHFHSNPLFLINGAQQRPSGFNRSVKSAWLSLGLIPASSTMRALLTPPPLALLTMPLGSDSLQNLGCSWILTEDVAAQTISSGVAYLWPSVSEARCGGPFSACGWRSGEDLWVT